MLVSPWASWFTGTTYSRGDTQATPAKSSVFAAVPSSDQNVGRGDCSSRSTSSLVGRLSWRNVVSALIGEPA